MQNLTPNVGYGAKLANWTATVATGTALVNTYSATTGPDNTPGNALSCTGTSATLSLVSNKLYVPADEGFLVVSVIAKASNTANSTIVPISVAFSDAAGGALLTYVPIASAAAASTSAILYNAVVGVPVGAVTAIVTLAAYNWVSTGGYTLTVSSPEVLVP